MGRNASVLSSTNAVAGTVYTAHGRINAIAGKSVCLKIKEDGAQTATKTSCINGTGTWQEGDLNYDGQVTISDFIDLASNFNTSYSGEVFPISAADAQTLSSFAASIGVSVPEPTSLSLLATSLLFVRRRRR